MNFLRKNLFPFTAFAFATFLSVLVIEGFHHHDDGLEGHDDCSICSWQVSGSQAPSTPAPPPLFHALALFVALFIFVLSAPTSFVSFSTSGRAPPSILL